MTSDRNIEESQNLEENPNMKQALMSLVDILANLEFTFTGRLPNEIVIDPIAIYTEL